MPRRSPGALRAQKRLVRGGSSQFSQISGLGRAAQAAVRRLEADRFWPGCLRDSLDQFEQFLRSPGRLLYVPLADCPCHDPLSGRDTVEAMLNALPVRARRELREIVSRLDQEFERRTLPDPSAPVKLGAGWWHQRLTGR